jgi:hypothetical protein
MTPKEQAIKAKTDIQDFRKLKSFYITKENNE